MEFGDVFTIRLLTARPTVVAAAPESVAELLAATSSRPVIPDSTKAEMHRRMAEPGSGP